MTHCSWNDHFAIYFFNNFFSSIAIIRVHSIGIHADVTEIGLSLLTFSFNATMAMFNNPKELKQQRNTNLCRTSLTSSSEKSSVDDELIDSSSNKWKSNMVVRKEFNNSTKGPGTSNDLVNSSNVMKNEISSDTLKSGSNTPNLTRRSAIPLPVRKEECISDSQ